ncbi:unnamed protein product [Rhizophagus irregularis]|nr:unnamed protein product [Rhizophagus irregularis]
MEGTYKGLNQKEIAGEVPVSAEEIEIYNKVNQACSSRLPPEIKKEKVVVDEKIGQKRVNKEELSRGTISSEDSEDSNESENGETILEGKKQVMGGGKSKKGSKSRKSKKKSKKGW